MRFKTVSTAAVAIALLAAATGATSAQAAIEGPFYKKAGNRISGSKAFESSVLARYTLNAAAKEIRCTNQKLETGSVQGQSAGNASTSEATIVFEGCTVLGNGMMCEPFSEKVLGTPEPGVIRTNTVKGQLAFESLVPTKGEHLFIMYKAASGAVLATIKFTGPSCIIASTTLEGKVAAKLQDGKGTAITIEEHEPEEASTRVAFPASAEQIKKVFVEESKTISEVKMALTMFGMSATVEGTSSLTLAGNETWGVGTH